MVLAESATYGFSRKCFKWKTRYRWQGTSFPMQRALYCRPIATKLNQLVQHARWVQVLEFQEKPSNGSWDTAKEVLCSSSNLPLITDRSQPNWYPLQGVRGDYQVWIFRKISQTEAEIQPRRDYVQQVKWPLLLTRWNQTKVHCSASRVPLVTKVTSFIANVRGLLDMNFQENASDRGRETTLNVHRSLSVRSCYPIATIWLPK